MTLLLALATGLALGGPWLAVALALTAFGVKRLRGRSPEPPIRPVLLLVLVELRAGGAALSALQRASTSFPEHLALAHTVRVASVSGLAAAMGATSGPVDRLVAQLARCQRSGAPAVEVVRSMLESDIEAERARRIERARRLPIRLMIPVALLVLPGVILLLYTPALIRLWHDVSLPFT
jgi:hypothetical protein